ncbi:MAG: T9SS type A sorting domain-containing protein [Bacteroidota bacterium]
MRLNKLLCFALSLLLMPGLVSQLATAQDVVFDDMEHADPDNNGWFAFGSDIGGGGYAIEDMDLPADNGGAAALSVGFGGAAGFIGGFGRTNPVDLSNVDHFNFWINPAADQSYTLEINFQDDDNGDDDIPNPSADDDEYQFNCVVGPNGPCAVSGGGWQLVEIPFSELFDDNSFHTGGNAAFDPTPTSAGGNGQLVNVVIAIIGTGTDANFLTDYWVFTQGALSTDIEEAGIPTDFALMQNYPNPFNPSTAITFNMPQAETVNLSVFNLLGQRVATLIDGAQLQSGQHTVSFDATNLPTGMYIYRLTAGTSFAQTRRMTLVR